MALGRSYIFELQHPPLRNGENTISRLTGEYRMMYTMVGEATSESQLALSIAVTICR